MGFETLLGNDRLKENLTVSLSKGRVSHFYLISGPAGSGKRTLARLLAAAILCQGRDKPCGVCGPGRGWPPPAVLPASAYPIRQDRRSGRNGIPVPC